MRAIPNAVAALCVLAFGVASAQEGPAVWTDPSNRFTIDFASNGFTLSAIEPRVEGVVVVEHAAFSRAANSRRACTVMQERVPRAHATTQGEANARLFAPTDAELARALRVNVTGVDRVRINGVSVLTFRADTAFEELYWRYFILVHDGGLYQISVSCGGSAPLTMLEVTTMNRTLETLSFLPEASQ